MSAPTLLQPGAVIASNCSACHTQTEHLFTANRWKGGKGLVCLRCTPDAKSIFESVATRAAGGR